jgi:hypothetical protein
MAVPGTASITRLADRNNLPASGALVASAARTASADWHVATAGARGVIVVIDATASAATPSVVFTVRGYDPVTDKVWDILVSAAVTGVSTKVLRIYPGIAAVANVSASDVIPEQIVVHAEASDADSLTYSISVHALP